jgi:poly(A) polymerase
MTREALKRLKFTNEQIRDIGTMVELHMRLGEYRHEWSDAAVKRLIRATADYRGELFEIARCDMAAMNPEVPKTDLDALRDRIGEIEQMMDVVHLQSPLDGTQIMEVLGVEPGPIIKEAKEYLMNEVIEGRLAEHDEETALDILIAWRGARAGSK